MAVTHRHTPNVQSGTTATPTFTKPTGVVAGDLLYAVVGVRSRTVTVSPSAGWTQDVALVHAAQPVSIFTYWRIADGTEAATLTPATISAAGSTWLGAVGAFVGVDPANPLEVPAASSSAQSTSATTLAVPAITTVRADALLVSAALSSLARGWTVPAGMTQTPATLVNGLNVAREDRPTPGATGTRTWNYATGTAGHNVGFLSALRPAAVVDTTPPVVNVLAPTTGRLSRVAGRDAFAFDFQANEPCSAWEVRRVSADTDPRASGVVVDSGGAIAANTNVPVSITDDELIGGGLADGTYLLKVFTQDTSGNWST